MEPIAQIDRHLEGLRRTLAVEYLLRGLLVLGLFVELVLMAWVFVTANIKEPLELAWLPSLLVMAGVLIVGASVAAALHGLADNRHLVRWAGTHTDKIASGLETVMELSNEWPNSRTSASLVMAEADRVARQMAEDDPRRKVNFGVVRRLFGLTVFFLVVGTGLGVMYPGQALSGLGSIVLFPGSGSRVWLQGPAKTVEVLAHDIRTVLLLARNDGSEVRIQGDETGEVFGPRGAVVEISGQLTLAVARAELVFESGTSINRSPLMIGPGSRFTLSLTLAVEGQWYLFAEDSAGRRWVESARRGCTPMDGTKPVVLVEEPESVVLNPGETISVRYEAFSQSGLAGIDVVAEFPMESGRGRMRFHVRDLSASTQSAEGEAIFTMPDDVTNVGGRVDVRIEAFGRFSTGEDGAGTSRALHLSVDQSDARRLACLARWEDVLEEATGLLSGSISGRDNDLHDEEGLEIITKTLHLESRRASEAGIDSRAVSMLDAVVGAIESSSGSEGESSGDKRSVLSVIVLGLAELVDDERGRMIEDTLVDVELHGSWFLAFSEEPESALTTMGSPVHLLKSATRLLGRLENFSRLFSVEAELDGGMGRFGAALLARSLMQTHDVLARTVESAGEGDLSAQAERLADVGSALHEVVAAFRMIKPLPEVRSGREVALPPHVLPAIRKTLRLQREIMDDTAQVAFEFRVRSSAFMRNRIPDVRRLQEIVSSVGDLLSRVDPSSMEASEGIELAGLGQDVGTLGELLSAVDLDTALKVVIAVRERMAQLAMDLRDQAEWIDSAGSGKAQALRGQAGRLSRTESALGDVLKGLDAWRSERSALATQSDRQKIGELATMQGRVSQTFAGVVDAIGTAGISGSDSIMEAVRSAAANLSEGHLRLFELDPLGGEAHQRQAVQDLLRLRKLLERGGIALRPAPELVYPKLEIATAGEPADDAFERSVKAGMAEPPMVGTEDLVRSYYEAILVP